MCGCEYELRVPEVAEQLTHDEVVTFVKELDAKVAHWPLTLALADYFDKQRAKYHAEIKGVPPRMVGRLGGETHGDD